MRLTTDFECGSGVLYQKADDSWRLETVADACGYNKYFCFEAENDSASDVTLHMEIVADPGLGESSHFFSHFPSHIWYSQDDWRRWVPLQRTWEDSVIFHSDRIALKIPLRPGVRMQVATNTPFRYSDLVTWIEAVRLRPECAPQVSSLGKTPGGRDIPLLRMGNGHQRILIVGGQHASEHSSVWASQGVVEFLLSRIAEARRILDAFDIAIIPMLNVDGNVLGRSAAGLQQLKLNNSLDFEGASAGATPTYAENAQLWNWLINSFSPDMLLHFHGYMGWRRASDLPGDGIYLPPRPKGESDQAVRWRLQKAVLDRLLFETCGHSAHFGILGESPSGFLDTQVVERFGAVAICYECNSGTTGAWRQFRAGAAAFLALVRAALEDFSPPVPQSTQ